MYELARQRIEDAAARRGRTARRGQRARPRGPGGRGRKPGDDRHAGDPRLRRVCSTAGEGPGRHGADAGGGRRRGPAIARGRPRCRAARRSRIQPPHGGRAGMSDPRATLDIDEQTRRQSVLVGWEGKWASWRPHLRRSAGRPRRLLIGGEAGMGKNRYRGVDGRRARRRGTVLTGACLELGADGPPLTRSPHLRDFVRERTREIAELLSGSGRAARELPRPLPELASRWARATADGGPRPPTAR